MAGALQLVTLKFPGFEASRVKMVAIPPEAFASELDFDLHLLARHQFATNWARCSASTVLHEVAIRRACGEMTAPDGFTGLFAETLRDAGRVRAFARGHALHRLAQSGERGSDFRQERIPVRDRSFCLAHQDVGAVGDLLAPLDEPPGGLTDFTRPEP